MPLSPSQFSISCSSSGIQKVSIADQMAISPSQLWWSLVHHRLLFVCLFVDFFFFQFWMAHCSKSPGIEFLLNWFYIFYKILLVCTESERTVTSLSWPWRLCCHRSSWQPVLQTTLWPAATNSGDKPVFSDTIGTLGAANGRTGLTFWIKFNSVCQQMLINVLLNSVMWVSRGLFILWVLYKYVIPVYSREHSA